jgi:hypothetical protein
MLAPRPLAKMCPLCGGKLVPANATIENVRRSGHTTYKTRRRRGCKSCKIIVIMWKWRK